MLNAFVSENKASSKEDIPQVASGRRETKFFRSARTVTGSLNLESIDENCSGTVALLHTPKADLTSIFNTYDQ